MNKSNNDIDLIGFVFFIEATLLYIIDNNGNICLINGSKNQIKQFHEKEYYKLKHLYFIKKDNRNYFLYDMNKNTAFSSEISSNFFKRFAIVKFIVLDEIILNKNPKIELNNSTEKIYYINSKIQYFTILKDDESLYFSQSFKLIINNNSKYFYAFLYKEQINLVHCSLQDENINDSKCYELLFLSKDKNNLPDKVIVSDYEIKEYDTFNCTNRIRFIIMNVKKDNAIYQYDSDLSSFEVIYLINENKTIIKYGIFDINSFNEKVLIDYINIFDIDISLFVYNFWEDYDKKKMDDKNYNIKYYNRKYNNDLYGKDLNKKLRNKKYLMTSLYKKESLDNINTFNYIKNLCFFGFFEYLFNKDIFNGNIRKFFILLDNLDSNGYGYYNKIRILSGFFSICLEHDTIPTLINITKLDNENPYTLAIEFQKMIISNMKENSNIFYPILQINSKILKILPDNLWDYLWEKIKSKINIKKTENFAYTISLENINDMKRHLLTLEEDFFFIINEVNDLDFYGMYSEYSKLTTINQYLLYNDINSITNYDEKKDYAFSMNMIFGHERIGHGKEGLCNPGRKAPNICFNKNFQRWSIYTEQGNLKIGESGKLFESFISKPILIETMKNVKKFGKFLDYKYFIGDFKEINEEAIKRFKETEYYYKAKIEIIKFSIVIIIIYLFIVLLLYDKVLSNIKNYIIIIIIIIITLIVIILFIKSFKEYKEPYKYDHLFDKIHEDKEENIKYIYPDDYPMESETFIGRNFPFLQINKNQIRKKLKKYVIISKFHKF